MASHCLNAECDILITGSGHGSHIDNVNDEKTHECGKTPMEHGSSKNETVRDSTDHSAANDQEAEDCDGDKENRESSSGRSRSSSGKKDGKDDMGSSDPGSLGNSSLPNGSDDPDSDDPLLSKPANGTNSTFAPISVYTALGTSNGIITSPSVSVHSSRSTSTGEISFRINYRRACTSS